MKGTQGAIAKEFGAVTGIADKAGSQAGSRWGKTLNAGMKAATAAATTVVAAGGVAMGVALTKGLGRLHAIDTAKAKLRGLGNDADSTAAIMKNATAAVKGTSFGLDAAATTAAGAVAAGIKPGQQLESTLKTVANVAAATGRGMDDMGAIFNNVAANQKAYTQDIKQIAGAGLPIWEKLGEVLGKTTDEVRAMASNGQIDFATFEKAASLAAGNVADEMGKTLPGSLANAGAAISRIGANMWKGLELDDGTYTGIYGKLAGLVQAFTNALGPVEDLAAKVGDAVGQKLAPAIDWLTEKFNSLGDSTGGLKEKFGGILSAVAPAGAAFAALGARGLAPLISGLPVVGKLLGPLSGLLKGIGGPAGIAAAALFALAKVDPTQMADGFTKITSEIPGMLNGLVLAVARVGHTIIPELVNGIATNLPILLQGVTGIIQAVVSALASALPVLIQAAIILFQGLVTAVGQIVGPLVEAVLGVIPMIIDALLGMIPTLITGALQLFMALVQAVTEIVPPLLTQVWELLPAILESLLSMVPALIDGAMQLFMGIVQALPLVIPPLLEAVVGLIPMVVETLISLTQTLLDGAMQLFMALAHALPIILPSLLLAVIELMPSIIETLITLIPELLAGAVQLFMALVQAVPMILGDLWAAVTDMGTQLVGKVIEIGPAMLDAGKQLIGGLVQGIKDKATAAVDAITEVGGKILGGIKGFFGIKSPSRVMAGVGGFLDEGLAGGIGKGTGSVAATQKMANQVLAVTNNLKTQITQVANTVGLQVSRIIESLQQMMNLMAGPFKSTVNAQLVAVANLFRTILPNAVTQMVNQMRSSLGGFQSWMGSFKNGIVAPLNAIKTAFSGVPASVSSSWSRLRSATASPTNYVINTVYMNGLRTAVSAIARAAGVGVNLPAVRGIGYASGGVLPGYTPGRDVYDFYSPQFGTLRLSGGEGILRPEVVRALGGAATINAWNAARGRGIGNRGDRGYASGGILDFLNKGSRGWSVNTKASNFNFALFDDPRAAVRGLVTNPSREYAARAGGAQIGRAFANTMPALAAALEPGLAKKIAAAGGGGTGLVAAARKALGVPYVWGGASLPPGLDCSGLVYWAYQQMGKKSVPRLTAAGYQAVATPVSSPRAGDIALWGNPAYHIAIMTGANSIVHAPKPGDYVKNAALYGSPTFGRLKYDQGGYLMPGLSMVENRTGKPEPVFTSEQFEAMRGGGGLSGRPVQILIRDASGFRQIAEGVVEDAAGGMSVAGLASRLGV